MYYLNPRNLTKWIRMESYEKWDEVYKLNLTWMADPTELSENGTETLQRGLKELWEEPILNTIQSILFFLACGSVVIINLEVKETRNIYSWTLEPDGEIEFTNKENELRALYHLLKQVQDMMNNIGFNVLFIFKFVYLYTMIVKGTFYFQVIIITFAERNMNYETD